MTLLPFYFKRNGEGNCNSEGVVVRLQPLQSLSYCYVLEFEQSGAKQCDHDSLEDLVCAMLLRVYRRQQVSAQLVLSSKGEWSHPFSSRQVANDVLKTSKENKEKNSIIIMLRL